MGQYTEHRRPMAVPKVRKVEQFDTTGEGDLRNRENYEKAVALLAGPAPKQAGKKKSFAALLKKK